VGAADCGWERGQIEACLPPIERSFNATGSRSGRIQSKSDREISARMRLVTIGHICEETTMETSLNLRVLFRQPVFRAEIFILKMHSLHPNMFNLNYDLEARSLEQHSPKLYAIGLNLLVVFDCVPKFVVPSTAATEERSAEAITTRIRGSHSSAARRYSH
jgi:hypothetical protein